MMVNLSKPHKNSITKVSKGEVWLAHDINSNKVRPFLIMSDELSGIDIDVTVTPTTTHNKRNEYDIEIIYWKDAGLSMASVARCSKITVFSYLYLVRKLGILAESDMKRVNDATRKYLAL